MAPGTPARVVLFVLGTRRRLFVARRSLTVASMTTQPITTITPSHELDGRIAAITGAASGIGAAIARRFVDAGARVGLIARRADRLAALAADLGADHALPAPADVTDEGAQTRAAERIAEGLGEIDIVVANAGIMLPSPVMELRTDEWQRMIDLNLTGVLSTVTAFLPSLIAAGEARGVADLVLVSSLGARVTFPGYAVYGATKAAVS